PIADDSRSERFALSRLAAAAHRSSLETGRTRTAHPDNGLPPPSVPRCDRLGRCSVARGAGPLARALVLGSSWGGGALSEPVRGVTAVPGARPRRLHLARSADIVARS